MHEMSAPQSSPRTDRELTEAVLQHQDELAFRELYRRYTPRLFVLVARLLARGDHEAEDVVQEIWIHAFQSLGRFDWNSSFSTWLTGHRLEPRARPDSQVRALAGIDRWSSCRKSRHLRSATKRGSTWNE